MWPFKKKDDFDLDALEKELTGGSSFEQPHQSPSSIQNDFPEEDMTPKTTREDRLNMAMNASNSDEQISSPSGFTPVKNYNEINPSAPSMSVSQNSGYSQHNANYGNMQNNDYGNNNGQTSQTNNFSQAQVHKTEILEKQIEILASKIDLLRANIESIQMKLNVIDQKIEKKSNSW
ncbi:MAG: hypothetical protein WC755_00885 [Candidatus Woesearchaeota archaeon]|jgi:hypothetical protein